MKLKWSLKAKGMRPHGQLRQKLAQKFQKLESHLEHFPADAVFLEVYLEKHARKALFTAGLTLRLPSNQLRAQKSGADPVPAFDQAIKALLRELSVLKSALRHEKEVKRFSAKQQRSAGRVLAGSVGSAGAPAFLPTSSFDCTWILRVRSPSPEAISRSEYSSFFTGLVMAPERRKTMTSMRTRATAYTR